MIDGRSDEEVVAELLAGSVHARYSEGWQVRLWRLVEDGNAEHLDSDLDDAESDLELEPVGYAKPQHRAQLALRLLAAAAAVAALAGSVAVFALREDSQSTLSVATDAGPQRVSPNPDTETGPLEGIVVANPVPTRPPVPSRAAIGLGLTPQSCSIEICNSADTAIVAEPEGFAPNSTVTIEVIAPSGTEANVLGGPYSYTPVAETDDGGHFTWRYWWTEGMETGRYLTRVADATGTSAEATFEFLPGEGPGVPDPVIRLLRQPEGVNILLIDRTLIDATEWELQAWNSDLERFSAQATLEDGEVAAPGAPGVDEPGAVFWVSPSYDVESFYFRVRAIKDAQVGPWSEWTRP